MSDSSYRVSLDTIKSKGGHSVSSIPFGLGASFDGVGEVIEN